MALIIKRIVDADTPESERQNPRRIRLVLERSTYVPADKSAGTKASRSVTYLGTVRAHLPYEEVDTELLNKLTSAEKHKLIGELLLNKSTKFDYLDEITSALNEATAKIKNLENADSAREHVKLLAQAWANFDAAAKSAGAKRTKKPAKPVTDSRQRSLPGA